MRQFRMYYFSELSADIMYQQCPDTGIYRISATHTNEAVPISDWFHFVDTEITEDPLIVESNDSNEALANMAGTLSDGPIPVLERAGIEEPTRQFFSDFMSAFYEGEYNINTGRRKDYVHDAGDSLMEEYESMG